MTEKHHTVMVLIVTDETPRRALMIESRKHQRWMPPGGHQESDENPLEAAIREVKEETGIDIADYLPKPVVVDEMSSIIPLPSRLVEVRIPPRGSEPEHYHLDSLYIIHVSKPLKAKKNDAELASIGWLSLDDMKDIFVPEDVRQVLRQELIP